MNKITDKLINICVILIVYGLFFDIKFNNKFIQKEIRIHLIQL